MPVEKRAASTPATDEQSDLVEEQVEEVDDRPCFFRHVVAIVRIWATLSVAGLWVCTVLMIQDRAEYPYTCWYALASTIIASLLELIWLIDLCVLCKDDANCCCACWKVILWIDNWKRGIIYILASLPHFALPGKITLLAIVCGVLFVVMGLMYIIKSFENSSCVGGTKKVIRRKRPNGSKQDAKPSTPPAGLPATDEPAPN